MDICELSKRARRGEAYCVLVATKIAMPQRPVVEDPRSARQTCLACVRTCGELGTDCDEVFRRQKLYVFLRSLHVKASSDLSPI